MVLCKLSFTKYVHLNHTLDILAWLAQVMDEFVAVEELHGMGYKDIGNLLMEEESPLLKLNSAKGVPMTVSFDQFFPLRNSPSYRRKLQYLCLLFSDQPGECKRLDQISG